MHSASASALHFWQLGWSGSDWKTSTHWPVFREILPPAVTNGEMANNKHCGVLKMRLLQRHHTLCHCYWWHCGRFSTLKNLDFRPLKKTWAGQMDRQTDGKMDGQTDQLTDQWMDREADGRTDRRIINGRMDRRTDRWTDRQTDGRMEGWKWPPTVRFIWFVTFCESFFSQRKQLWCWSWALFVGMCHAFIDL